MQILQFGASPGAWKWPPKMTLHTSLTVRQKKEEMRERERARAEEEEGLRGGAGWIGEGREGVDVEKWFEY